MLICHWNGADFVANGLDYLVGLVLQLECLGIGLVALAPQLEGLRVYLIKANLENLPLPMMLLSLNLLLWWSYQAFSQSYLLP